MNAGVWSYLPQSDPHLTHTHPHTHTYSTYTHSRLLYVHSLCTHTHAVQIQPHSLTHTIQTHTVTCCTCTHTHCTHTCCEHTLTHYTHTHIRFDNIEGTNLIHIWDISRPKATGVTENNCRENRGTIFSPNDIHKGLNMFTLNASAQLFILKLLQLCSAAEIVKSETGIDLIYCQHLPLRPVLHHTLHLITISSIRIDSVYSINPVCRFVPCQMCIFPKPF